LSLLSPQLLEGHLVGLGQVEQLYRGLINYIGSNYFIKMLKLFV
jgi:hypothetical protein